MPKSSVDRALYGGLLLFGFSLPLSKGAGNVLLAAIVATTLAAALADSAFRDRVVRGARQPLTSALALFSLVAFVGILHTKSAAAGFGVANKYVSLPAVYFLVAALLRQDKTDDAGSRRPESLLFSFLAGLAVLDALGALTYLGLVGHEKGVLPLSPLNLHHIWFANINALGIYTGASLLRFPLPGASARGRAFLWLFLPCAALCVLFSLSRTAWLSLLATTAVMLVLSMKSGKKTLVVVAGALLACVCAYRFIPLVRGRIDLVASEIALFSAGEAFSSIGGRFLLWKAAVKMFLSSPLVGVGTGDFVSEMDASIRSGALPAFLREYNQPHNMYLFALATNGLAGLAALLGIFYRSVALALPLARSATRERLFGVLALATAVHFIVGGLLDSFFNIQVLRYAFAFIMGVCIRSARGPDSPGAGRS